MVTSTHVLIAAMLLLPWSLSAAVLDLAGTKPLAVTLDGRPLSEVAVLLSQSTREMTWGAEDYHAEHQGWLQTLAEVNVQYNVIPERDLTSSIEPGIRLEGRTSACGGSAKPSGCGEPDIQETRALPATPRPRFHDVRTVAPVAYMRFMRYFHSPFGCMRFRSGNENDVNLSHCCERRVHLHEFGVRVGSDRARQRHC